MVRYQVTREFAVRELNGPFTRTIGLGEQLVSLDEREDFAVFAVLIDGEDGDLMLGPQYEVSRDLFDASTAATHV
jgi:hypothetical protein